MDETYKCLNGGTCLVGDNGEVFCMCLDQYEGTFCEHGKILRIAASFYLELADTLLNIGIFYIQEY